MRRQFFLILLVLAIILVGCKSDAEIPPEVVLPEVPPEIVSEPIPVQEAEVAEISEEKCFTPEEFEKEFCEKNRCTIAIVVKSGTKSGLESELMQYKNDVEKEL